MSHQNRSGRAPNRRPPNGATAWPGRFNETIFGPRFPHPGCQTLRLNQLKTGKQHGLTGSTDPFLTCISPHPAAKRRTWIPQRKQVFWLALPCIPCSIEVLAWFCYGCQTLRLNQLKTGKQHGLTGSTDPFLTCISPRPAANCALESHKENKCFGLHCPASPVALRFWPGFATISHKNHQILTPNARYLLLRVRRQKKTSRSRETAWPGRFNGSIFDIHVTPPRCQTIAVKFWFCFCDNVTPKPLRCV